MEYVILCKLTVNGKVVDDFKKVTEKEIDYYKQINLMNKTGFCKVTPRYGVTVDYVVPTTGPEFAWKDVANGTLIITDEGGVKTTYSGVYVLKVGEKTRDGENEIVRTIDLGATRRV